MPTTNIFFDNFNNTGEQNLIDDLIIESIKMYGHEVYYMPRSLVAKSNVFGEDLISKFEDLTQCVLQIMDEKKLTGNEMFELIKNRNSEFNVKIFNLNGKFINFAQEDTESLHWTWNGKNESGDLVPFGIYILYFIADSGEVSHKEAIVVIK